MTNVLVHFTTGIGVDFFKLLLDLALSLKEVFVVASCSFRLKGKSQPRTSVTAAPMQCSKDCLGIKSEIPLLCSTCQPVGISHPVLRSPFAWQPYRLQTAEYHKVDLQE